MVTWRATQHRPDYVVHCPTLPGKEHPVSQKEELAVLRSQCQECTTRLEPALLCVLVCELLDFWSQVLLFLELVAICASPSENQPGSRDR